MYSIYPDYLIDFKTLVEEFCVKRAQNSDTSREFQMTFISGFQNAL